MCEDMKALTLKIDKLSSIPSIVQGSIASSPKEEIGDTQLQEGLQFWITAEDDELLQNVEVDEIMERSIKECSSNAQAGSQQEEEFEDEPDCQMILPEMCNEPSKSMKEKDKEIDSALKLCIKYFNESNQLNLAAMAARLSHEVYQERIKRPRVQLSLQCFFDKTG